MKNNKGFIGIGIIIAIIAVLIVGGLGYYKSKIKTEPIDVEENNLLEKEQQEENILEETTEDTSNKQTEINYIKVDNNNAVVLANNKFTFDIYPKLAAEDGNIFFSPLSISSAFGMVYEGANGETASEIKSVFNFPSDINVIRNSFASINNEINKDSNEYKLSIANALWVQKDYKFLESFISSVGQYYDVKATNVDFKNKVEDARQAINKWVEDKTNNKIKNILPINSLSKGTKLVLTNAIYFNGKWDKPFLKNGTKSGINFFTDSENSVEVNMMQEENNDGTVFNYAENDSLQILEMPYKGKQLSIIVLLPKKNDISSFEKLLTLSNFNNWK
ncbi:MAG: serpin family protein, partial [Candidatus Paceibacterota bacterium]